MNKDTMGDASTRKDEASESYAAFGAARVATSEKTSPASPSEKYRDIPGIVGIGNARLQEDAQREIPVKMAFAPDNKTLLPIPTEEELTALVRSKWKEIEPSHEAQKIRSKILNFDSGKYNQTDDTWMPGYIVEIADIAAQAALNSMKREISDVAFVDGHGDTVKHSELYDECPTCKAKEEDLNILREDNVMAHEALDAAVKMADTARKYLLEHPSNKVKCNIELLRLVQLYSRNIPIDKDGHVISNTQNSGVDPLQSGYATRSGNEENQ